MPRLPCTPYDTCKIASSTKPVAWRRGGRRETWLPPSEGPLDGKQGPTRTLAGGGEGTGAMTDSVASAFSQSASSVDMCSMDSTGLAGLSAGEHTPESKQPGLRRTRSRMRRAEPFIIGVAGGTASGKTTVCDLIMQNLHGNDGLVRHACPALPVPAGTCGVRPVATASWILPQPPESQAARSNSHAWHGTHPAQAPTASSLQINAWSCWLRTPSTADSQRRKRKTLQVRLGMTAWCLGGSRSWSGTALAPIAWEQTSQPRPAAARLLVCRLQLRSPGCN